MKPIRVLHCIFSTNTGGLEAGVVKLINNIDHGEVEQAICSFTPPRTGGGSCLDALTNPHCRIYQLQRRRGNDLRLVGQLMDAIRDFRPTIVHTRSWGTYLEGAMAATLTGTPALVHGEHGTPSPGRWRHRWAYRLLARRTRVVITVSEALANHYREMCRGWGTVVRTIHNGVDDRHYVPAADPSAAKANLQLSPSALVVGTVGRLVPVKAFEVLIEAMAHVVRRQPEAVLLLVGEGPERERLVEVAERANIASHVRFVGHTSAVVPYYQAMDVYVNSSHSEGISNSILEAQACGVPVVATAVGGNPEILRHAGIGGMLVPPGVPEPLGEALARILEDRRGLPERRAAARRNVVENFSLRSMIENYKNIYIGLASSGGANLATPVCEAVRSGHRVEGES